MPAMPDMPQAFDAAGGIRARGALAPIDPLRGEP